MKHLGSRLPQLVVVALLTVAGAATWVSFAAGGASVATAVAVGSLVAATTMTLVVVRRLRGRVALTERRLFALGGSVEDSDGGHRDLRSARSEADVVAELARLRARFNVSEAMVAVTHSGHRAYLSPESAIDAVRSLVESGRLLDADQVVRRFALLSDLSLGLLRSLGRGVRTRGYLARAQVYFERAAAVGDVRDRRMLELRSAEVSMMSGAFRPALPAMTVDATHEGRVLHVVGRALPTTQSGYTLRTHGTARAQVALGLEAHVFVQAGVVKGDGASSERVDDVWYHRHPGGSVFELGHTRWLQENAEALLRLVLELRPSVLHAHSDFINGILATAVGKATGVPVVYESRGFWEETWLSRTADTHGWLNSEDVVARHGAPESYEWRRLREAEVRRDADAVVTLGRAMRDRIVSEGLPGGGVTIVPNAVDAEAFARQGRAELLGHALGIPAGATVIGCVTSVVEYEGLETLVDAFRDLGELGTGPVWLLIVGDGPVLPRLRARVEELGLKTVSMPGRVPHVEVPDHLSLIDVFVIPRRNVAVCRLVTPLKPFEALSAGCALVMSDVPALREIAEDSGAADLVPPDDAPALARALATLVQDPEGRRRSAEHGAAWVRSRRGWQHNAQRYSQVYRSVARVSVEAAS